MIEWILRPLYLTMIVVGVLMCVWWAEMQYQAVRGYYPGVGRWEYVLLYDKLRITPHD